MKQRSHFEAKLDANERFGCTHGSKPAWLNRSPPALRFGPVKNADSSTAGSVRGPPASRTPPRCPRPPPPSPTQVGPLTLSE
jgi:hypothetical protein